MIQDLITNNTELCDIFIFSNRAKAIKASIIYFLDMEKKYAFYASHTENQSFWLEYSYSYAANDNSQLSSDTHNIHPTFRPWGQHMRFRHRLQSLIHALSSQLMW